jgi:hypothetical protein
MFPYSPGKILFPPELAAGLFLGDSAKPIPLSRSLNRSRVIATAVPGIPRLAYQAGLQLDARIITAANYSERWI